MILKVFFVAMCATCAFATSDTNDVSYEDDEGNQPIKLGKKNVDEAELQANKDSEGFVDLDDWPWVDAPTGRRRAADILSSLRSRKPYKDSPVLVKLLEEIKSLNKNRVALPCPHVL